VRPSVERELGPSDGLDRIMARRCDFAARYCLGKLSKRGPRKGRGRDRDLIFEDMTPKQRRQQAGARTDEHKKDVSLWLLQQEMAVALWTTGEIRKTEFIKTVGLVSKSTAYKHWDEACERLGLKFRDGAYRKKAKPITGNTNKPSPALPSLPPFLASDFTTSILPSTGQQVQTADPSPPDPGNQRSTAGPPDRPWPKHADRPAEACPETVSRVLEPA
jgi:hypothetical protein